MTNKKIPSSFRDPSGHLFFKNGILHRHINFVYKNNYDFLISSGLYKELVDSGLLIPHEEITDDTNAGEAYKVLKPEFIPFISYPYEWCFSQMKDAALTTLKIQKKALEAGMSLKDCSAFNIQFRKGRPVFIDTLSFEKYKEGYPWVAYRQFCQHFLAPLSLMSHVDIRLNQLSRIYIDGVPLDLASSLLSRRTYLNFFLLSHIHLHAKSQKYFAAKTVKKSDYKISRTKLFALIDSLESAVRKLTWQQKKTEWADYYEDVNYSLDAFDYKKRIVEEFLDKINPKVVWDLGANTGLFSRIASDRGIQTISFDIDPVAVEKNYLESVKNKEVNILPLLLDLTNPSSGIGWGNEERESLIQRGPADLVFALALIHHLAISNNLPFDKIAEFLSRVCNSLIIEFVPKSDSRVRKLLATREDIFPDYTRNNFEKEFSKYFEIQDHRSIQDSERVLYLMIKK